MPKMFVCLWSDDKAEEMARFYKSVFPGTKVGKTATWGPNPMGVKVGSVLTMDVTLLGLRIMLLNGFAKFPFNESVSLCIPCEDQREIDFYWKGLLKGGGKEVQCGWLIDRFGVRWQVFPAEIDKWNTSKDKRKKQAFTEAMWKMVKLDYKKLKAAFDQA